MLIRILPKKLVTAKPPVCACCLAGAMTKRPWKAKGGKQKLQQATEPRECFSVDQIESRTPRFLGVLRGFITKKPKRDTPVPRFCGSLQWVHILLFPNFHQC